MKNKTIEVFSWLISDNYLSWAVTTDINSFAHQKRIKYKHNYILINENWENRIRNFIWSNNEKWLIFLKKTLDRLYNWDISYSKHFNNEILNKKLNKEFYIKLDNLFYYQIKKPWINELTTEWNYNSSSRIFKQILEESIDIINEWDIINIELVYWYTNYSKLWKNIVFWKKMIFQNYQENEELFSSFTDKLNFVEFYIKIYTNSDKIKEIKDIAKKNIDTYKSKYNSYTISDKKWSFLKLKNKIQIDSLISHSLCIPINNEYSINNKSKIINYGLDVTSNNLLKKQNDNCEITLWKIYKNNVIENKDYLVIKDKLLKNQHSLIIWQSWSGKSHSWAWIIAWKIIKSIKEFNYDKKYWDRIIICDPHSAFWNNIADIIWKYQLKNKVDNYSSTMYQKKVLNNSNNLNKKWDIIQYKDLIFNPLFNTKLENYLNDKQLFLSELNLYSDNILNSIKWYFDESAFWARNQNLLKKIIEIFIVFNLVKYNKYRELIKKNTLTQEEKNILDKESIFFSIWDIINILVELVQDWDFREDIFDSIKDLINNSNTILEDLWENFFKYLEYLKLIVKSDKSFIESTINKLWVFSSSLYRTFWWWVHFTLYTINLEELYLKNSNKTDLIIFDLWDYSWNEKSIISNFITTYSYNFWTKRDLTDSRLWEISIYIDEVNSVLSSSNSIEVLKNLFFEIRKYGINLNLYYQNSKQKWFYDLYSNAWYIITFSNSKDEIDFLLWDFNSWTNTKIKANDIINLNRWSFYILLKTINKNLTLYCDWLDFNNQEDFTNIIS